MPITKLTAIPILGLLTWRPLSGYDLKVTIERSLGNFWSESYGQIYPQLTQLAQDGLIEPEAEPPSSGRNKKVYRITDAGRRALADWLAVPPASRPKRDERRPDTSQFALGATTASLAALAAALRDELRQPADVHAHTIPTSA